MEQLYGKKAQDLGKKAKEVLLRLGAITDPTDVPWSSPSPGQIISKAHKATHQMRQHFREDYQPLPTDLLAQEDTASSKYRVPHIPTTNGDTGQGCDSSERTSTLTPRAVVEARKARRSSLPSTLFRAQLPVPLSVAATTLEAACSAGAAALVRLNSLKWNGTHHGVPTRHAGSHGQLQLDATVAEVTAEAEEAIARSPSGLDVIPEAREATQPQPSSDSNQLQPSLVLAVPPPAKAAARVGTPALVLGTPRPLCRTSAVTSTSSSTSSKPLTLGAPPASPRRAPRALDMLHDELNELFPSDSCPTPRTGGGGGLTVGKVTATIKAEHASPLTPRKSTELAAAAAASTSAGNSDTKLPRLQCASPALAADCYEVARSSISFVAAASRMQQCSPAARFLLLAAVGAQQHDELDSSPDPVATPHTPRSQHNPFAIRQPIPGLTPSYPETGTRATLTCRRLGSSDLLAGQDDAAAWGAAAFPGADKLIAILNQGNTRNSDRSSRKQYGRRAGSTVGANEQTGAAGPLTPRSGSSMGFNHDDELTVRHSVGHPAGCSNKCHLPPPRRHGSVSCLLPGVDKSGAASSKLSTASSAAGSSMGVVYGDDTGRLTPRGSVDSMLRGLRQ